MMPFDDALAYMQRMAQDKSDDTLTFLKLMYNVGYKIILTEFGRQVTEEDATLILDLGQRQYQVPPDCNTPKTLTLIDGTSEDPLVEMPSEAAWKLMRSGAQTGKPAHFHYKPRFGVSGGVIELYPKPGSDSYQLNMVYEASDHDLSQTAYATGTISLTQGGSAVTGSGASFTAAMVGRYLICTAATGDRLAYRIVGYNSATSIALENNYAGVNVSGGSFRIVEIPNLPDDMQIIPCYFALEQHWSSKGNIAKQREFMDKWVIAMARAKKTHATVTRGNIISQGGTGGGGMFPQIPAYFPGALAE